NLPSQSAAYCTNYPAMSPVQRFDVNWRSRQQEWRLTIAPAVERERTRKEADDRGRPYTFGVALTRFRSHQSINSPIDYPTTRFPNYPIHLLPILLSYSCSSTSAVWRSKAAAVRL